MKYAKRIMRGCTVFLFLLLFAMTGIGRPACTVCAAEGHEETVAGWKLIDHMELQGDWERAFYDRLVEESSDDGALIDVSKGDDYFSDGCYVLNIMEFSGRVNSPEAVEKACSAKVDEKVDQIHAVFLHSY